MKVEKESLGNFGEEGRKKNLGGQGGRKVLWSGRALAKEEKDGRKKEKRKKGEGHGCRRNGWVRAVFHLATYLHHRRPSPPLLSLSHQDVE